MNAIVLYKSKYGSSRQYALWLAKALQCKALDVADANLSQMQSSDIIIYAGGLYAGSVSGFKQINKQLDKLQNKKIILCMVGMTNPAESEKYNQVYANNVPEQYRSIVKPFALRGDQLFSKMSRLHRLLMNAPKSAVQKIPEEQRTEDDRAFLENFGQDVRFAKQENIQGIVEYVKGLNI